MEYKLDKIDIDVKSFLQNNGVEVEQAGYELKIKCPFNNHEHDVSGSYGFCMSKATTAYICHKCGEKGNIFTLCKKLDWELPNELKKVSSEKLEKSKKALPEKVLISETNRDYLNKRGISNEVIELADLSEKKVKGSYYISIPIHTLLGDFEGNKLRQFPSLGNQKMWEQKGARAQLYGLEIIKNHSTLRKDIVVITEGELDALAVLSQNYPAVSGTNGANTWVDSWSKVLLDYEKIYIALDNDDAGVKGAKRIAESLWKNKAQNIFIVNLPKDTNYKDIGEFISGGVSVEYILENYSTRYPPIVSIEGFEEMGVSQIAEALDPIIKLDKITKVAFFVASLGIFTERHVVNVAMNGQSSTGKTFIVKSIVDLFPDENVLMIGNASKRAFIHQTGDYDKETNTITIDFENKIICLLDTPSTELMETLRSFLSQDAKEITFSITDKNESGGQRTKNVKLKGPASFVLCTAGLLRDEQESTRLLVLSPEVSREKSEIAIQYRIDEATDHKSFYSNTVEHPSVTLLKARILAIKQQQIEQVDIPEGEYLREVYLANTNSLQPRHVRDFHRFKSLIAGFATFNYLWRQKKEEGTLVATKFDIDQAGILWKELSEPQELGLTPYVLTLYREIIAPAYLEVQSEDFSKDGCTIKDLRNYHFKIRNAHINEKYLRAQIIPQLETAGLVELSQDVSDKRIKRIIPIYEVIKNENNSISAVGVKSENNNQIDSLDYFEPVISNKKTNIAPKTVDEYSFEDNPLYGFNS